MPPKAPSRNNSTDIVQSLRDNPIAVIAIALSSLAGGLLIWGFFGTLTSEGTGTGLIVRGNRLFVVNSQQEGIIKQQYVKVNDPVKRGDLLMSLDTSQQQIQIESTRLQLKTNIPLSGASVQAGQMLEATNKRLLEQAERAYQDQAPSLKKRIGQQEHAYQAAQSLYKSGIVSASDLSSAFDELSNIKSELLQLAQNINNTKAAYQQARQQNAGNAINLVQQNASLISGLAGLKETVNQAKYIRSPITGTVVGFEVTVGNLANPGDPLMTIMPTSGPLRAILLVGSNDFQRINIGDDVLLSPTATPSVRFGFIKGKVIRLAQAPATQGELMKAFGSTVTVQTLLSSFNSGGQVDLPFLVDVEMEQGLNGLPVWTLGKQPPWGMRPGSTSTARIVSDKVRPISLILPFLRGL
jgi:HlyD family secretion protein